MIARGMVAIGFVLSMSKVFLCILLRTSMTIVIMAMIVMHTAANTPPIRLPELEGASKKKKKKSRSYLLPATEYNFVPLSL